MSTTYPDNAVPALRLAHIEIRVQRLAPMVAFYTETLGFVITDATTGPGAMVFLSRSPDEHHQVVLAADVDSGTPRRIDHIAFRLDSLQDLRAFRHRVAPIPTETVSHGTSWSVYVTDPEDNRLEFFCDTPWHVEQPAKWLVDLDDAELDVRRSTRERVATLPGFSERTAWVAQQRRRIEPKGVPSHVEVETAGDDAAVAIFRADPDRRDMQRGDVALSSHRTGAGIITYYRRPDGGTVVRLRRYG